MKRVLFTIAAILIFISCAAQNRAKEFDYGIKVLGTTEISAIPLTSNIMVLDETGFSTEISLANLTSQLNIATGNITQEEVEDILGNAIQNGSHTGATFVYNDNASAPGTISVIITDQDSSFGSLTGNPTDNTNLAAALAAKQALLTWADYSSNILSLDAPSRIDLKILGNNILSIQNGAVSLASGRELLLPNFETYSTDWNNNLTVPTKNDIYNEIEIVRALISSGDGTNVLLDDGTTAPISGLGGGSVDTAFNNTSSNALENQVITNRFLGVINKEATSPDNTELWKGTKAQFYSEYGNPPTGLNPNGFYVITDSIPATPIGGGDMLRDNYDGNDNNVVDNAEQLGGQDPSVYLDGLNEAEVDAFVANNGYLVSNDFYTTGSGTSGITLEGQTSGAYTIGSQSWEWSKIGNQVVFTLFINSINGTAPTGDLELDFSTTTIPPIKNNPSFLVYITAVSTSASFYSIQAREANDTKFLFPIQQALDGTNSTLLANVDFTSGYISISGSYLTY